MLGQLVWLAPCMPFLFARMWSFAFGEMAESDSGLSH
jgi:hypothetical protein